MEKTRKPEVKLEVDRAVDRSLGVAGLREIGSDICGAWEGSGCLSATKPMDLSNNGVSNSITQGLRYLFYLL